MVGTNSVMGLLHDTAVFTQMEVNRLGICPCSECFVGQKSLCIRVLRQGDWGNESGRGSIEGPRRDQVRRCTSNVLFVLNRRPFSLFMAKVGNRASRLREERLPACTRSPFPSSSYPSMPTLTCKLPHRSLSFNPSHLHSEQPRWCSATKIISLDNQKNRVDQIWGALL